MNNELKQLSVALLTIISIALLVGCVAHGPRISAKNIPVADIDSLVRKQIENLYSPDPVQRGYGAYHLGRMGTRAAPAVPFLIGMFRDTFPLEWQLQARSTSPRAEAIEALGLIGKPAVEPLIAALEDKDRLVRSGAAKALGGIGEPAVESLIAVFEGNPRAREWAAEALGLIGKPAVEPLIAALKDKHYQKRLWAAEALGRTGDTHAVEPLIATLKDRNHLVREFAASALRKITGQRYYLPFQGQNKWQKWWNENKEKY